MEQLAALTQRVVKEKRERDLKLELEQKGYISPRGPLTKKAMLQFIEANERFFWRVSWPDPMPNKYSKKQEIINFLLKVQFYIPELLPRV